MPKLLEFLNDKKMTLIVAVPQNNPELVLAAVKGGADAIQLQINSASFGSFADEQASLKKIVEACQLPVGLNLGYKEIITAKQLKEIKKLGFDFFVVKHKLMSNYLEKLSKTTKVISLHSDFSFDSLLDFSSWGADVLDAAVVPSSSHGQELKVGDLQNYISIILASGVPVIVPTQKDIRPSEVAIMADTGAKGLLLTPVVTGTTAQHIEKNVREFRVAVDDLG